MTLLLQHALAEPECPNGNLPYMTSNGTHRIPLKCSATSQCPAPYSCDFETNLIGSGSFGYCCFYETKSRFWLRKSIANAPAAEKLSSLERTSQSFTTDSPPTGQSTSTV